MIKKINQGKNFERTNCHPLEKVFAEEWDKLNSKLNGCDLIDYLMVETPNEPNGEVTERDRKVAATIIQWLGTSVGQEFLATVNCEDD